MSGSKLMCALVAILFHVFLMEVSGSEEWNLHRVKRGAAYAGARGPPSPKLSPSVALGAYGGFVGQSHGQPRGKLTVQEALGQYGGFLNSGGHRGPNVLGSGGDLFNKEGHPGK